MKRISPTRVEIDLPALRFNYRQLQRRLPASCKPLCVVKSNAYGHGAPEVARALEKEGAGFFGVGTVDEGVVLREAGVKKPILILLGLVADHVDLLVKHRLTPVVYDLKTAQDIQKKLKQLRKKLPLHVKVDTGMTRLGVLPENFQNFCQQIKKLSQLEPQGILTHLADAGEKNYTQLQKSRFEGAQKTFERYFGKSLAHWMNSQASIDRRAQKGKPLLARFGIALYGAYPLERDEKLISLKPVLSWKSRIVSLKKVPAHTPVSYGRTFKTRRPSVVAVVPVGYADGYPRILSRQTEVLVRGRRALQVGTICMDMMMIDVTKLSGVKVGDDVVLIGRQGKLEIRAEELAQKAGTISYEIFCGISERVSRVYR